MEKNTVVEIIDRIDADCERLMLLLEAQGHDTDTIQEFVIALTMIKKEVQ